MRRLLAIALLALFAAPASASAEVVFERYRIPSVDGSKINVEVMRDPKVRDAPVLLTYTPYGTLGERRSGNLANDDLGKRYVPRGYARAVADVIGTRGSTGCWDYGGKKEIASGVDVVKALAKLSWSNGRVGMIGGSYDGTTATMVASQGAKVPQLKAIVPIAAISRWYGYAYSGGVRYLGNSEVPTDEGFDTPLAFDFGLGRTVSPRPDAETLEALRARLNPCDSVEHTERGYDTSPDYDGFWVDRDYRRLAGRIRAATLLAHGWQDYNVKQEEAIGLWEGLPATTFKRLWMFQGAHSSPSGDRWLKLRDDFLDRFLKGVDNGITKTSPVVTQGRDATDAGLQPGAFRNERVFPPVGSRRLSLWLTRTFDQDLPGVTLPKPGTGETGSLEKRPNSTTKDNAFTWVDTGTVTEEVSTRDPLNEPGHGYYSLYFKSAPLDRATRIAGTPVLDAYVRTPAGGHLTPVLVDVAPSGMLRTIARGFLNVDYRDGLERAQPVSNQWVRARVAFLPQDVTLAKGHRIGLIVQSSNTVWAVPGTPGVNTIATGTVPGVTGEGSVLRLTVAPR